jgi:hypothetical protein
MADVTKGSTDARKARSALAHRFVGPGRAAMTATNAVT